MSQPHFVFLQVPAPSILEPPEYGNCGELGIGAAPHARPWAWGAPSQEQVAGQASWHLPFLLSAYLCRSQNIPVTL